MKYIRTK